MIRFCAACEERIFGPGDDELCPECRADIEAADRYLAEQRLAESGPRVTTVDESEIPF